MQFYLARVWERIGLSTQLPYEFSKSLLYNFYFYGVSMLYQLILTDFIADNIEMED
jgi:hypothetical protein